MKKIAVILPAGLMVLVWAAAALALTAAPADILVPRIEYALTTDIPQLLAGDYQVEFTSMLSLHTAWAVKAGFFKRRQGTDEPYADGKGRWDIGFRWRYYLVQRAPHWLFLGVGWNNRPQDGQITPLGEAGFTLNIRPLSFTVMGTYGYEFYLKQSPDFEPHWVKGLELRAGFCF